MSSPSENIGPNEDRFQPEDPQGTSGLHEEIRSKMQRHFEHAESPGACYRKFGLDELGINANSFLANVRPAYEELPWDRYDIERGKLSQPCRKRALAEFSLEREADTWRVSRVPAQPYVQPTNHGTYNRTTPRVYPEVSAERTQHEEMMQWLRSVADMIRAEHPGIRKLRIIATFLRVITRSNEEGLCALERGPHYDGMDYIVSALVINRENLLPECGESSVLTPSGETLFRTVLQPGEGIFQDDKNLMHQITNIQKDPRSPEPEGHRDMMGLDILVLE